jgi:hypothetical protein
MERGNTFGINYVIDKQSTQPPVHLLCHVQLGVKDVHVVT